MLKSETPRPFLIFVQTSMSAVWTNTTATIQDPLLASISKEVLNAVVIEGLLEMEEHVQVNTRVLQFSLS